MIRLAAVLVLMGGAAIAQVVANGTAEPAQVRTGQATRVRFFADIANPNLVPGSVNLLRVGPAGTNPVIVGTLSDSGSDGDEIAGDGRYSGELTIQEAAPTTLTYYINGAIRNQIVRPRSGNIVVSVMTNRPPVAVIEPVKPVRVSSPIVLDGRNSFDLDRDLLTFSWTLSARPAGSAAAIDNSTFVKPAFTPDVAGNYKAALVVNDGSLTSTVSEVTIAVSASNALPTAVIGGPLAQAFGSGATKVVVLDGTGSSDPESAALTYVWRLVSRPASSTAPTFVPLTSATPTLTADKPGRYVVELIVRDGVNDSAPVQATVILYTPNTPPTITLPADQTVTSAVLISLNGTSADPDAGDNIASNVWAFVAKPAGSASALNGASFTPDVNGDYLLEFTATDNRGFSRRGRVVVRRAAPVGGPVNQPPLVSAGQPQSITLPATASLLATASDDGQPAPAALTISWMVVSGPTLVTFSNPAALATTATFYTPGVYQLRFTANDGALSASSDVAVTVSDSGPVLPAIQNRTISLGSRFQLRLVAGSTNPTATLAFSLPGAPVGALLNPTPMIDWTPATGQVGTHTFTVRVTDSAGRFDQKSFQVTVLNANRPPVLAAQANASAAIGSAFSRTLTATDPDPGATLTYSLVSGPAGMNMSGATINWTTQGTPYVDYTVICRVTDQAGAYDVKKFVVTPLPSAPPVAADDLYTARLGQTLVVPPAGVLLNDVNPFGGAMTAAKLSNPSAGTVSAFGTDGGFTYAAPPVLPLPPFVPVVKTHIDAETNLSSNPLTADLDQDGKAEIVMTVSNSGVRAYRENGSLLWQSSFPAPWSDCGIHIVGLVPTYPLAIGDIDDDGKNEVVAIAYCNRDGQQLGGRFVALNGLDGTIKWMSPLVAALPLPTSGGPGIDLTSRASPTIARLRAGESPSILFSVHMGGVGPVGTDSGGNPVAGHLCRYLSSTADVPWCSGVIALNGVDGTVRQRMIAARTFENPSDTQFENRGNLAPIVADLDNNGTPEIVAGGTVFNADGVLLLPAGTHRTAEVALANMDDTPDVEMIRLEYLNNTLQRIAVYKHNGTPLWAVILPGTNVAGRLTVADVDSSGRPTIFFNAGGSLWALDYQGAVRWIYDGRVGTTEKLWSKTRVAVFDLDGDGISEVILSAMERLLFLEGNTGAVKYTFNVSSIPGGTNASTGNYSYESPAPVVSDTDGSGHARVIFIWVNNDFSASSRITILKGQNDDWRPVRQIMNQSSYFAANINDNGSLPPPPFANPFATAATNLFGGAQPRVGPVVDPRLRSRTSFTYTASAGALTSNTATVTLDLAPNNRPPVFISTAPTRFLLNAPFTYTALATDPDPGDSVTYSLPFTSYTGGTCSIVASTGVVTCTQIQNFYDSNQTFLVAATDSFGATTLQTIAMQGVSTAPSVPNVVGLSQTAAATSITGAGFRVGTITPIASLTAAGTVTGQIPASGTLLAGEKIALTVSTGPAPIAVPFVTGLPLTIANSTLAASGFTPAITRVFSTTVPANAVISQTPAAGTLLSPTPANPVGLVVSSGNGLQLRLSRSLVTADQTVTITPLAFDVNGSPVAVPTLTYGVSPALLPQVGTLPGVASNVITPASSTRGTFLLTATDSVNGRTATAEFVVLPPREAGEKTPGEAFATMVEALESIFALKQPLIAARAANDTTQMRDLLRQMVLIWRTVNLSDVRLSYPLTSEDQFLPSVQDLMAAGLSNTPQDLLINQILKDANDDLQAFTDGLRAPGTSMAQLNAMADQFSTRAARMNGLSVSGFGGIYNRREYQRYMAHRLPAFYEALMEEIAQATGLGRRTPIFPYLASKPPIKASPGWEEARSGSRNGPVDRASTLAEVAVTLVTNLVVEKIMDEAFSAYKNAKAFALDIMKQAAWTAVAVAVTAHLKQFVLGGDIEEVISGASLSFRVFSEPDVAHDATPGPLLTQGIVEVKTDGLDPHLSTVMIIGPTLVSNAATGIAQTYGAMKGAVNYGVDPATNPLRARNMKQLKKVTDELWTKLKAVRDSVTNLQDIIDKSYQSADSSSPGCIFSSDARCSQLIYEDGIRPVYRYSPPGSIGLGGLPVPIIFIVQADDGNMYFGTPLFLPAPVR